MKIYSQCNRWTNENGWKSMVLKHTHKIWFQFLKVKTTVKSTACRIKKWKIKILFKFKWRTFLRVTKLCKFSVLVCIDLYRLEIKSCNNNIKFIYKSGSSARLVCSCLRETYWMQSWIKIYIYQYHFFQRRF